MFLKTVMLIGLFEGMGREGCARSWNFFLVSTRFECVFSSLPLVWSVFLNLLHSFRVCFFTCNNRVSGSTIAVFIFCCFCASNESKTFKLSTFRKSSVSWNYTRNESRRWENPLETSREDEKIQSKRVEKMRKYTRNGLRRWENTLKTTKMCERNLPHLVLHKSHRFYSVKIWRLVLVLQ